MSRGRIVVVYGTRPEAIKLGPVVAELRYLGVEPTLVCTGQHTDLLRGTPAETDLSGSLSLNLPSSGNVLDWVENASQPLEDALNEMRPIAAVVVQGDTMSAYLGAKVAFFARIPVAHVEAGLRSHCADEPWPEEWIRKTISAYSDWNYAPTKTAVRNLKNEGYDAFLTGNTVVSALHRYANATHIPYPDPQILVTMHRREWVDGGDVRATIEALYEAAEARYRVRYLWPMHPNVLKISGIDPRKAPDNVLIAPPLAYRENIRQLARSTGVLTDSGGIQEEAGVLGIPCAVMRRVTDRPESVDEGVARLFSPDPDGIRDAIRCLTTHELPRKPITAYGTPESAKLIAQHLKSLT